MALLYDANGRAIRDGVLQDDIVAAIQAAAIADEFPTAQEIADRHGMSGTCLRCAIKNATTAWHSKHGGPWRVCITCFHDLDAARPGLDFSSVKVYTYGLITRNVV